MRWEGTYIQRNNSQILPKFDTNYTATSPKSKARQTPPPKAQQNQTAENSNKES